ncbi:electron transfer flavoprotein subunit beta/FixA family protein [Thermodesulfobacteriota bacterium]
MINVAVCCKGVPKDVVLESVQVLKREIHLKNTNLFISEIDAYALETAVFLKKTYGVNTVALTVGPLRVQEVLYFALAKGIDKALRVDGGSFLPEISAWGLIPPLKEISPKLILVGVQSEDWMGGEVGFYIAHALNMGWANAVVKIGELNENYVFVQKEIGAGKKAEIRLKLPAVLSIQSGIQPLRYVSTMRLRKARNLPVKLWGKVNIEQIIETIPGMTSYEIDSVGLPEKKGYADMITGERSQKVKKLIEIIGRSK